MSKQWNRPQWLRSYHTRKSSYIDFSTGELVEEEYTELLRRRSGVEPAFVKIYQQDGLFAGLSKGEQTLLLAILSRVDYRNRVVFDGGFRDYMEVVHGIKRQGVYNATSGLVARGYLYRVRRGEYLLSPDVAGKGMWGSDISPLVRVTNYTEDGQMELLDELPSKR